MAREQLDHAAGNERTGSNEAPTPFSPSVRVDVAGLTHPGKVRPRNEDHFIISRIGRFWETVATTLPPGEVPARAEEAGYGMVVADGMGGHAGGELASRMAISDLIKQVMARPDWIFRIDDTVASDATQRSERRFKTVNKLLIDQGRNDPALRGMGTTMTTARTLGRHLQIVHVGDSRAYLLREGRLHRLTRDHTYVQLLVDTGQLSEEDAARSHARHLLVNALGGSSDEVAVDVDQVQLADGDRVLLCSDGLSDLVEDDAIRQALIDCPQAAAACQSLVDLALEHGGRDNITVIVAAFTFI